MTFSTSSKFSFASSIFIYPSHGVSLNSNGLSVETCLMSTTRSAFRRGGGAGGAEAEREVEKHRSDWIGRIGRDMMRGWWTIYFGRKEKSETDARLVGVEKHQRTYFRCKVGATPSSSPLRLLFLDKELQPRPPPCTASAIVRTDRLQAKDSNTHHSSRDTIPGMPGHFITCPPPADEHMLCIWSNAFID